MEYCDGGAANDIFKVIKEPMPEPEIQAITRESLKGLQYLHSLRIVHRDIKGICDKRRERKENENISLKRFSNM
jgi:serine/threonine protein kinase